MIIFYDSYGFFERAEKYKLDELILNDRDSSYYFDHYSKNEERLGNIEKAIYWEKRALNLFPENLWWAIRLPYLYSFNNQYDSAYKYFNRYDEWFRKWAKWTVTGRNWIWYGYTFWLMGNQEEAKYYFDKEEQNNIDVLILARIYALLGDTEKAFYYLDEYNSQNFYGYEEVVKIKIDPFFENIRDDERFLAIVQNMEELHNKGHEKVRAWLKENDML